MAEKTSELGLNDATGSNAISTIDAGDETSLQTRDVEAIDEEATDETEQLREQIEETRRGMSETIDAIQEKLSFSNISEQVQTQVSEQINNVVETAKDAFYGKAGDIANTVSRGIKQIGQTDLAKKAQQNPAALAIIGAGIGALLISVFVGGKKKKIASYEYDFDNYDSDDDDDDDDEVRYTDSPRRELKSAESRKSTFETARNKVGDTASSAYESVSGAAGTAYEGVTGAAGSAYESVGSAASKTYETVGSVAGKTFEGISSAASKTYSGLGTAAGYTYEKAGDLGENMKVNYEHYIEENPLAVGAVALALGAAVGFAIPLTQKENEYLGEYRDQVVEKAQEAAQDAIGSVKQMATDAQKIITEEVKSKTA